MLTTSSSLPGLYEPGSARLAPASALIQNSTDWDVGQHKSRQLLHSTVQRLCVAAGVPVVCPHSLRGVWATAGVRSGALSHTVAAALGHGSFAVTAKHYVQPGALDGARTQRLVQMMDLDAAKSASPPASPSAEKLLATLPPETLARLVELAGRTLAQNG